MSYDNKPVWIYYLTRNNFLLTIMSVVDAVVWKCPSATPMGFDQEEALYHYTIPC